jgi:hypothetical protein
MDVIGTRPPNQALQDLRTFFSSDVALRDAHS